jgi:ATP-binding cassette, subfamily C (CFTR/MRP), member 1
MHFHRKCGIRSSGLMFIFWFLLFLFAVPQFRTEIVNFNDREVFLNDLLGMDWPEYQFYSYMVYFGLLLINLVLNCFADSPPRHTTFVQPSRPSPEMASSFLKKLFFLWFDTMTWKGFRQPLEVHDMWDVNPENTSRELNPVFDKYWNESVEKGKR